MITPEDGQHLNNILDAIEEIEGYVQDEDINDFLQDENAKEAVTRRMQDIGGAAKLLSDELKSEWGDIDWEVLIRLEDAMYNQSVEFAFDSIWSIIENDLPKIKIQVADVSSRANEEEDIEGTIDPELNIPEKGQFKPGGPLN